MRYLISSSSSNDEKAAVDRVAGSAAVAPEATSPSVGELAVHSQPPPCSPRAFPANGSGLFFRRVLQPSDICVTERPGENPLPATLSSSFSPVLVQQLPLFTPRQPSCSKFPSHLGEGFPRRTADQPEACKQHVSPLASPATLLSHAISSREQWPVPIQGAALFCCRQRHSLPTSSSPSGPVQEKQWQNSESLVAAGLLRAIAEPAASPSPIPLLLRIVSRRKSFELLLSMRKRIKRRGAGYVFFLVLRGCAGMVWCSNCAKDIIRPDRAEGKICCSLCGRVLDEDNFSQEPTFVKGAGGQSQLSGNYVRTIQNEYSVSRERTLNEAYDGIDGMMYALGIDGGDSIARPALAFYTIALERNFTRGRRKEQVQASCLYIACRENKKPYLLIDFSEHLRINVYVLGAVFLQLCKLLSLEEHPIIQKPVDPSLFIHRFTDRLFGGRKPNVSKTALQIVASMKRDWMQTGRKPSGLCGAALYISALSHGLKCTKTEIIEEFNMKADELDKEERLSNTLKTGSKASVINELLCEHKGSGKSPFAHGLCEKCYEEFIKLSGGLNGGSEPPAFQRAEMERLMAKEAAIQKTKTSESSAFPGLAENRSKNVILITKGESMIRVRMEYKQTQQARPFLMFPGASKQDETVDDSSKERIQETDATFEESESLSDTDDIEVASYLLNEEEKEYKKTIWEEMNKEYLEEQAAKEAAALAAKKAFEANLSNCSGDVEAAQRLAAAAAEAVAKSKKEKRQKRAAELKNAGPPQTALEATSRVLDRKRLSSKVKYDVLEKLLGETEPDSPLKKIRTEEELDHDDNYLCKGKAESEIHDIHDMLYYS
ncbi:transcription initiation factor brf1 [Striga asiatica]|uniref:Transcription initiation factor brf1 n=1 Tax=Striga asiatica TaxID=4170 RepID=A0A5A7PJ28_STRAF|nr:transcription initiation factor brf1 [Striga asiatica]